MCKKFKKISVIAAMAILLIPGACKEAPKVNHAVISRSDASCLSCHQSGASGAPVTKHPKYADCLRCHKEAGGSKTDK